MTIGLSPTTEIHVMMPAVVRLVYLRVAVRRGIGVDGAKNGIDR